jgi:hypothetical protein
MPIDFFKLHCKTESKRLRFGLCDDTPPPVRPSYIDETDSTKWIGIVNNPDRKNIEFYAIDNCVDIRKPDGNIESRCDGMLHFDNNLTFVELKAQGNRKWLTKARSQLTITIEKFKEDYSLTDYDKVEAYACNSLKPAANPAYITEIQKFRDDTGLLLHAQQEINL